MAEFLLLSVAVTEISRGTQSYPKISTTKDLVPEAAVRCSAKLFEINQRKTFVFRDCKSRQQLPGENNNKKKNNNLINDLSEELEKVEF